MSLDSAMCACVYVHELVSSEYDDVDDDDDYFEADDLVGCAAQ